MSDIYDAIFQAVRQKLTNCDVGSAIIDALSNSNIGYHAGMAAESIRCAAVEYERPSVLFRPNIHVDGNSWVAVYGENLQDGVAGFGNSPSAAMRDFDANWIKKLGAE